MRGGGRFSDALAAAEERNERTQSRIDSFDCVITPGVKETTLSIMRNSEDIERRCDKKGSDNFALVIIFA